MTATRMKCLPIKKSSPKCCLVVIIIASAFTYLLISSKHDDVSVFTETGHIHDGIKNQSSTGKVTLKITAAKITTKLTPAKTTTVKTTSLPTKPLPLVGFYNASAESYRVREIAYSQKCVRFAAPGGGTVICIYPKSQDKYVSGSLSVSGMWEFELVRVMESTLYQHPDMALLDLGCNIGVFTIYAAKMGRRVVGVDANKINLAMLYRSLNLDKLQERVTLIWNAVSDIHESVVLKEDPGNNGGMFVQTANKTSPQNTTVQAITLNDLAPLFKNTSLFIKMDIEGSELKALRSSSVFFKTADVRYVMMEMMWTRKTPVGKAIFAVLTDYGFRPFPVSTGQPGKVLGLDTIEKWPDNVIWIKSNS